MNKKFLSAILFGALMVTSTGTFVSCKDYDDEIDEINAELVDIKSQISALQNQVNSGNYVTGVSKTADGITFTFSNDSPVTVEIKDGAQGEPGKDGTIVEVKDGVLYIDGEATEIKVCETPVIEEEEFLPAVTIVDGEWAVLQEDGTYLSTGYAASSIAVAENTKGGYTLTIKDAEGEETEIELPATKIITDLKATVVNKEGKMKDADVTIYYGTKVAAAAGLTFNGKTYAQNTYLLSQGAVLSAIVNPLDADATKYEYKLVDTKGNAPLVVSGIKQNMSENALGRAVSANQGVWDMTLSFASAANVAASGIYALTTETVNGTVASPYDVKITASSAGSVTGVPTSLSKEVNYNTDYDLGALITGEWTKYVVDYYFEITDKTVAANNSVTLEGNVIKTTKNSIFDFNKLQAKVLLVDGTTATIPTTIYFKQVAPSSQLANIEWTINAQTKSVYLSLSAIQSQLVGSTDASLPAISQNGYTWADGTELDKKSVVVNGVYYGADVTGKTVTKFASNDMTKWITSLDTQLYSLNANATAYENATTIQKTLYAKFTFDETLAFPGEYIIKVGFRKNAAASGDFALVVPVKVTIKAPTQTIVKHDNYFSGNNAVAYGEANGTVASYKLTELFKTTGLTFTETPVVKSASPLSYYDKWLQSDGVTVNVPKYLYGTNVDNTVTVGSSHEFTASIIPFNNAHIQKTVYAFNLTIKSAINEGDFSSTASKTITTSEPIEFAVTDFTAKDVFGDKFNIANLYKYDSTAKKYTDTVEADVDDRIVSVKISAADDNATNYLEFDDEFTHTSGSGKATDTFTVKRKSGLTQLVSDTTCKLNVTILDKWGVKSTATVTVVLQKFGN